MKEKDIHNLIKQSIKSPSDNFTDKLMDKIITQEGIVIITNWKIIFLLILCFLLFLLSFAISVPELNYFNFTIRFSPMMFTILSIPFILYEFNQLFEILRWNLRLRRNHI